MDNTEDIPTCISFCSGYSGIERGIERVVGAIRTLAHVEIEAFACENLVNKMESFSMVPAPIWTNVKTFPSEIFRDRVDILTGGYPCQPFSQAGKRLGDKDPRHLWPYIKKAIITIRPTMCFFENVEGHITMGLSTVISDLEELGYKVSWGIFSAAEVGAPHQRKRVFILAYRNSSGSWKNKLLSELRSVGVKQSSRGTRLQCDEGEVKEITKWPARPEQEQYEWEESRVI